LGRGFRTYERKQNRVRCRLVVLVFEGIEHLFGTASQAVKRERGARRVSDGR